jgi:hypothetical protein
MSLHQRRYSDWLLNVELKLTQRRDAVNRLVLVAAGLVAVAEALLPWDGTGYMPRSVAAVPITPSIPPWLHIAAAALLLPLLWWLGQNDYRAKYQAFTHAMNDLGRRLLFLDNIWDTEHAALLERYESSVLRPTQRALQDLKPGVVQKSLRLRVDWYYRALPTSVHEADRMGALSLLHPRILFGWTLALALCVLLLPGGMLHWGPNRGLTMLVLLLPLYLVYAHYNTRFAFELALFDWLRMG